MPFVPRSPGSARRRTAELDIPLNRPNRSAHSVLGADRPVEDRRPGREESLENVPPAVNLAGRARNRDAMDKDTDEDEDVGLLARVRAGDDAGRCANWCSGTRHGSAPGCARTVLSPADAKDVLQETFLALWHVACGTARPVSAPRAMSAAGCGG